MSAKQLPENKRVLPGSNQQAEAQAEAANNDPATQLQRTAGNAAIQRLHSKQDEGSVPAVSDDTAQRIQRKLGAGQEIDQAIATKAGGIVGDDYQDVRIHNDAEADSISRQLGARAFTSGNDIFFQKDEYTPNSLEGQKLITHELTHVSQQGGQPTNVQAKMEVGEPDDPYEKQADKMADQVTAATAEAPAVQRQEMPEEEVQLSADPMAQLPEEEMQLKPDQALQRQELPEEEMQLKRDTNQSKRRKA